jgi:hypothetical protein
MLAGLLRHLAILLFCMSLLHAPNISAQHKAAQAKMQKESFGSISFPTLGSLQDDVFKGSAFGRAVKQRLENLLIKPTPTAASKRDGLGRRRQRDVEDAAGP